MRNWLDSARQIIESNTKRAPSYIFNDNIELVSKADAVIAEIRHDSFGVGYQIATALQLNKPVLLLTQKYYVDDMIGGLRDDNLVFVEKYKNDTVNSIIENFLRLNDVSPKDLRFNFFIDREIYNYLRWASYKTKQSKSRILRDIIKKEINNRH